MTGPSVAALCVLFEVVTGQPTDEEIAALVAVLSMLAAAATPPAAPAPPTPRPGARFDRAAAPWTRPQTRPPLRLTHRARPQPPESVVATLRAATNGRA